MKYLSIILSLAATSTAIDAAIHLDNKYCGGRWIACFNLNPNTCCSIKQDGASARFDAIPREWTIQARSYRRANCDPVIQALTNWSGRGGPKYCETSFATRSVGYGFMQRQERRDTAGEECQKPNALGLEDGTQYNLTAMEEGLINELMGYTDPMSTADIPELFKAYKM